MKNMNGEYDFGEIYEKAKENFNIDLGEYINKKLEIKYDKVKGISIYTNDKITKGEILVVSKAIIATDIKNKNKDKNLNIQYDNPDKEEFEKTGSILEFKEKSEIQDKLSYKLSNYLEDFSEFLYLFDGRNKNINLEGRLKTKETDLKKIQRVLKYNSKILFFEGHEMTEGLWFYPSLFNHSCIANCHQFGFGDILIIIAINDIGKNCELFLNYLNEDLPFDMRQNILKEKYDFNCYCELCNYEKNKIKTCPEKKTLNEYLLKLRGYLFESMENKNYEDCPSEKEVKGIIKFLEQNKKLFSCYEMSSIYIYCSLCIRKYDVYICYEYLEKALKYSENRNYEYEKFSLKLLFDTAKILRSEVRLEFIMKKVRAFYEKYFPSQKKFINIIISSYKV